MMEKKKKRERERVKTGRKEDGFAGRDNRTGYLRKMRIRNFNVGEGRRVLIASSSDVISIERSRS